MVLSRYMISQDRVFKVLWDFAGKSPLRYVTIFKSSVAIATVVVRI